MKLILLAVGRLKEGPERELFARYVERIGPIGRSIGLGPVDAHEIDEARQSRAEDRKIDEARRLLALAAGRPFLLLDERAPLMTSEAFAARIARHRDEGASGLCFLIGGADGHGDAVRAEAKGGVSFGAMTLPHQLARVLLVEQLYRAATILAGHPYHRA